MHSGHTLRFAVKILLSQANVLLFPAIWPAAISPPLPAAACAARNLPTRLCVFLSDNSQGEFLMDAVRETTTLIAADKVPGTDVFNNGGNRLGSVHDLMIDKQTGQVAYAILSFGGFLGVGSSYHPLPWSLLRYDTNLGGYVVEIDESQLKGAPSYPVGTDRPGAIPNMRASSTTITASAPTGTFQARFDAFPSGASLGAVHA
jgi:hypothetical protein